MWQHCIYWPWRHRRHKRYPSVIKICYIVITMTMTRCGGPSNRNMYKDHMCFQHISLLHISQYWHASLFHINMFKHTIELDRILKIWITNHNSFNNIHIFKFVGLYSHDPPFRPCHIWPDWATNITGQQFGDVRYITTYIGQNELLTDVTDITGQQFGDVRYIAK